MTCFSCNRSGESLMAVIPPVEHLQDNVSDTDIIRVPLFLVRVDGIIYNTGRVLTDINALCNLCGSLKV